MIRFVFVLSCVATFSGSIFGQSIKADLGKSFDKFSVVKINNREALRKAESGMPFEIQTDEKTFRFILKPNDVRSADYKAEYTDKDGRHSLPRGEVFTYQGTIIGEPNSLVALTIDGTKTEGYLATASENFFIESAKKYSSLADDSDKVIYRIEDKASRDDNICGLDEEVAERMKTATSYPGFNTASSPQIGRRVLEVATEADKEFVQNVLLGNGDPAKANSHILSVMNQVDAVYRRDLNLRVVVTFQHAWMPDTIDPYADLYGVDLLYAFTDYWNVKFPASNVTYRRDVGHLFTLKSGDGLAIPSSVCQTAKAYSLTSINSSNKWVMTAHEIGHNLGAGHACIGSVMGPAFNSFATGFCQFSIDQITNYVNTAGTRCLNLDSTASAKPLFDFDGDDKADISVFRPSNGFWYISKSSGGYSSIKWGQDKDVPVPGDYDGDGKADLAVYRRGRNGTVILPGDTVTPDIWYILRSSDNTFYSRDLGIQIGSTNTPTPADYDGDGKTDLAVYRSEDFVPAPGYYIVLQSSTNTKVVTQWGLNSDKRVPADYDGDGRADYAVYRDGRWYILQSSNGAIRIEYFGLGTDRVVPGDYDGDGLADLAVWRPANGYWYRINSSDKSFNAIQFGLPDDLPTPADYDSDGKTDIAVFRPSTGVWYLLRSRDGFAAQQFGLSSDTPIPNVFVTY